MNTSACEVLFLFFFCFILLLKQGLGRWLELMDGDKYMTNLEENRGCKRLVTETQVQIEVLYIIIDWPSQSLKSI